MVRKTVVKRHSRKKQSGGSSTVKRHTRNINQPSKIPVNRKIIWDKSAFSDDHLHPDGPSIQWVEMSPATFLSLANPVAAGGNILDESIYNPRSIEYIDAMINEGKSVEVPYLIYDINSKEIVGHEGRHRAFLCYLKGIKSIPVAVRHQWKREFIVFEARGDEFEPVTDFSKIRTQRSR